MRATMVHANLKPSEWETFTKTVPWKDITLGFIVPKAIFYVSMGKPWLSIGIGAAILWCVGLFAAQYIKARKTNIWAIVALAMILLQLIPVIVKRDPNMNFVAGAASSLLIGLVFLISIAIRKPLMQILAEQTGTRHHIPEHILRSPYYGRAWSIITATWAVVYFVEAGVEFLLIARSSGAVLAFDAFCGWPTTILLILFTVRFPRIYWAAVMKGAE